MGSFAPVAQTTALTLLDDLLAAERALRHAAEMERDTYRRVMGELAEALAPELLEQQLRQGDDPARWPASRWQATVPELLSASWRRLEQQDGSRTRQAREATQLAQQQLAEAKAREHTARAELQAALQQLTQVRAQLATTQAQLDARSVPPVVDTPPAPVAVAPADAQPADRPQPAYPPPPILPSPPPPTFRQPDYYPRDARLLYLLGRTGRARRPWLLSGLGQYEGLPGNSGALPRCIKRLVQSDLVEELSPKSINVRLLRLTPAGATTYQALFQEPPQPSELTALLEQHQPDGLEHAALVLTAAQALEDCGAQVTVMPPRVDLPGGRVIAADLRVCWPETDECQVVEVERGLGPATKRTAKWRNLLTYQGAVYVVGPNMTVVARLVEEVVALGQPGRVYGSDLDALHKQKPKDQNATASTWRWALERVVQP
ncbi:MAG: hypothetical protein RBT75_05165 [Anaerolineae bacterium]|jgi:hypothetical protein|nr:hypothetical protein [Anaerolineae bacterium]